MIITNSDSLEGYKIHQYKGVVYSQVTCGVNAFADFKTGIRDVFGGRSKAYEKRLQSSKLTAIEELKVKAKDLGANAILTLRLETTEISGNNKSMLLVSAIGTAVSV